MAGGEQGLPIGDPALVRALFDGSPAGIGVFDEDARYLRANRALQVIVGRPEADLVGRRVRDVVPGPLGAAAEELLRQVLAGGPPVHGRELTGPVAGLTGTRTFLVSYFRLTADDAADPAADAGAAPRAASIVVDVSEARRTTSALADAVARLELLGAAAAVLAEPLDLDRTLARLADLVVPELADHCFVDLVDPSGLRRAAGRHATGASPQPGDATIAVGQVVQYPPAHPADRALREPGPHLLVFDPQRHDYAAASPLRAGGAFAERVGMHSVIVTSLVARGRVVGLLLLARSITAQLYTREDAELTGQLADRAAVAIDTALLFARQQETALGLQRSLMPRRLPAVDGIRFAARYRPAGERAEVGGDWYDAVPLQAGRVAVLIGDVMGRGLAAAALMGQVRAALRAYAVQDLPPADVLAHADELVRGLDDAALVTCVYAVLDPRERSVTVASAGHLPGYLVDPDGDSGGASGGGEGGAGAVRPLPATGPPLGAGSLSEGPRYGQVTLPLPAAGTLALCTDGLVERREESLDVGLGRLEGALAELAAGSEDVETWARDLLVRLDPHEADRDDVALLLVRAEAATRPHVRRLPFDPDPVQVRAAREQAVGAVQAWLAGSDEEPLDSLVGDVRLLVSELVTNVVRHAGTRGELLVSLHRDAVVLEVRDGREATPRWRRAEPDDEYGRGMFLVGQLAQDWGVRAVSGGGKAVWCCLSLPPGVTGANDNPP